MKFWDSGVFILQICCTFDLLIFKDILGSFGAVTVSKWPVTVTVFDYVFVCC